MHNIPGIAIAIEAPAFPNISINTEDDFLICRILEVIINSINLKMSRIRNQRGKTLMPTSKPIDVIKYSESATTSNLAPVFEVAFKNRANAPSSKSDPIMIANINNDKMLLQS